MSKPKPPQPPVYTFPKDYARVYRRLLQNPSTAEKHYVSALFDVLEEPEFAQALAVAIEARRDPIGLLINAVDRMASTRGGARHHRYAIKLARRIKAEREAARVTPEVEAAAAELVADMKPKAVNGSPGPLFDGPALQAAVARVLGERQVGLVPAFEPDTRLWLDSDPANGERGTLAHLECPSYAGNKARSNRPAVVCAVGLNFAVIRWPNRQIENGAYIEGNRDGRLTRYDVVEFFGPPDERDNPAHWYRYPGDTTGAGAYERVPVSLTYPGSKWATACKRLRQIAVVLDEARTAQIQAATMAASKGAA